MTKISLITFRVAASCASVDCMTLTIEELQQEHGYISGCGNCGYEVSTMVDVYRFCPLCGTPVRTYEDIGFGEKGSRIV